MNSIGNPLHDRPSRILIAVALLCVAGLLMWTGNLKDKPAGPKSQTANKTNPITAREAATYAADFQEPPSPSWWPQAEIAANLQKIKKAVSESESMVNHRMRKNPMFQNRLTLTKEAGGIFVDLELDGVTVRVGDLASGKQIKGTMDGRMPLTGPQDLDPGDGFGYDASITEYGYGPKVPTHAPKVPMTPHWYADSIKKVADTILPRF